VAFAEPRPAAVPRKPGTCRAFSCQAFGPSRRVNRATGRYMQGRAGASMRRCRLAPESESPVNLRHSVLFACITAAQLALALPAARADAPATAAQATAPCAADQRFTDIHERE